VNKRGRPQQRRSGRPNPQRRQGPQGSKEPNRAGPRRRDPNDLGGDQVEGRHAVRELLLIGRRRVHELTVSDDIEDSAIVAEILDLAEDMRVPVTRTARSKLESEARTDAPQGVIARAQALKSVELEALVESSRTGAPAFLLALDGITDPGNLGAILRSAEVAGVTGVILPRHRAVRLTPAAVKAAAGAVEHLDIALVGGLPTALSRLRDLEVWSIGLDMGGERSVFEMDAADSPIVLVLGAEGEGLSRLVGERCDLIASIPQVGALESLNVAAAAAVACFEVVRRRS
jgi:23S rRNA (guanosine2251-2'-O)-methyltransferase